MRTTVAHLAERPDHRGKLEVLLAGSDGRRIEELPPSDEQIALAWARQRADDVRVHIWNCSTLWSADRSNPKGLPDWPGMDVAQQGAAR